MLLPHGYEGKGPDHSSGRLERFLQLAAKTNIRVTNPTVPAQYFHLLRRQAALLKTDPLPLVVMAPKSLLRRPDVVSTLEELVKGAWQPVIDDPRWKRKAKHVTRLVLCSGKFYYDLVNDEKYTTEDYQHIAFVRVEQLYPFPVAELDKIVKRYKNLERIIWAQEEPKNMGAWDALHWRLERLVSDKYPVHYIGRRRTSSPAEGSATLHKINQQTIIDHTYTWQETL
jgi:2-oxoglutarate dehydrogenase E1 component